MFLALQVILALGNRPKAEKLTYTISIAVFAFFSLYLIFCTVILTIKAFCPIGSILAKNSGSSINVFLGSTYGPIFAGIAGTFGAPCLCAPHGSTADARGHNRRLHRVVAPLPRAVALASLDAAVSPHRTVIHQHPRASPNHYSVIRSEALTSSTPQNIYAFCNLHDVSWGTKGSDKVDTLPAAQSKKDGEEKVVETHEKVQEGASRLDIELTSADLPFTTSQISTWASRLPFCVL